MRAKVQVGAGLYIKYVKSIFAFPYRGFSHRPAPTCTNRLYALVNGRFEGFVMREKAIEKKLVQAVKAAGGMAPKLSCPGMDGMPDRIVLMPQGIVAFVEVKRPGEKPRPLQVSRMAALRRLGFKVYVLDGAEQIGGIVRDLQTA
jgi:hypothetical protein